MFPSVLFLTELKRWNSETIARFQRPISYNKLVETTDRPCYTPSSFAENTLYTFFPYQNDRENIFLQVCNKSKCIIYFLFNITKLKVTNLNGKFRWSEQRRTREMFCSSKSLVCDEKLIFELIELFVDYKMASLVSLCRVERLAQNRLYENECMES